MALMDAIIIHGEFVLINIPKEFDDINQEIKKSYCLNCRQNKNKKSWICKNKKQNNSYFIKICSG